MRAAAAWTAAKLRLPEAVEPLSRLLGRPLPAPQRRRLIEALGAMSAVSSGSLAALLTMLADPRFAESALTAIRHLASAPQAASTLEAAAPAVERLLARRPDHAGLRGRALATLACLRRKSAWLTLRRWLDQEPASSTIRIMRA